MKGIVGCAAVQLDDSLRRAFVDEQTRTWSREERQWPLSSASLPSANETVALRRKASSIAQCAEETLSARKKNDGGSRKIRFAAKAARSVDEMGYNVDFAEIGSN